MVRMERLYAVNLVVAAEDDNNGGEGRGGKAGAPSSNSIAHINCQAVAATAAVEEEEEEGVVDHDGNRVANSKGGQSRTATAKMATRVPHLALGG